MTLFHTNILLIKRKIYTIKKRFMQKSCTYLLRSAPVKKADLFLIKNIFLNSCLFYINVFRLSYYFCKMCFIILKKRKNEKKLFPNESFNKK